MVCCYIHEMQIILSAACKMELSYWRELGILLEMIMVVACLWVIVPSGIFTHADNLTTCFPSSFFVHLSC